MLTLEPSVSLPSAISECWLAQIRMNVPISLSLSLQYGLDAATRPVVDLSKGDILVRADGADPAVHLGLGWSAGSCGALADARTGGELCPNRGRDTRQLLAYP